MIHERTFECDRIYDSKKPLPFELGKEIGDWVHGNVPVHKSATVTVRVDVGGEEEKPVQESVPFATRLKLEREKNSGWRHEGPGIWDWINRIPTESTEGVLECTFRPTPKPARVKWPEWLPDVTRAMISKVTHSGKDRFVYVRSGKCHAGLGFAKKDEFGVWPPDQSRFATRTADGFVELSECES